MLRFETPLSPEECRSRIIARAGRGRGIGPRVIGTCRAHTLRLRYRGRMRHIWAQTFRGRVIRAPQGSVIQGRFSERVWVRLLVPVAAVAAGGVALLVFAWSVVQFWRAPSWFELFASVFLALWLALTGGAGLAGVRCWRRFGLKDRLEILRFLRADLQVRRAAVPAEPAPAGGDNLPAAPS